jgi:hypothetical protein|tara:strand:- start:4640 stop:6013 length:1374 start_codon:yes stop_codon:yes gene_type:complete
LKIKYSNILGLSLLIFIILEGLDAFSIRNIPIYWIGVSFLISVFGILYFSGFRISNLNLVNLRNWIIYGILITLVQSLFNDLVLPVYASTSYFQYISLRLLKLVLFLFIIYSFNYLFQKYSFEKIISYLLISCLIISALSLISYFSYLIGYSDFPRNRSGSGGWTQPIERACSILRNYGTFREPSFLAIWTVPFLPYFFYLGKTNKKWYFLSLIPMLSITLSRSLTGYTALFVSAFLIFIVVFLVNKKIELNLIIMLGLFLITTFFSSSLSYQFPPETKECNISGECVCIAEDKLDELKNSENIPDATFGRFSEISSRGLDAFENTAFLIDYINNEGFSIFGDGFGHSNIVFSYAADEATKKEIDNQIIYRNPGQVVSFNNLYANILMSTGLIGLLWFLYIIIDLLRKLVFTNTKLQPFVLTSLVATLFMLSYQAEELSTHLAIAIAFSLNLSKNAK